MKNKLAKITTSAMLVLTTNSLPSYALNEYSVAGLPKESKTQTKQVTRENRESLIDKRRNPKPQLRRYEIPESPKETYCNRWIWHPVLKRWLYVKVVCGITD